MGNGSDGVSPSNTIDWFKFAQPGNVIIIDVASRQPASTIKAAVGAARDAGIMLCMSYNPGFKAPECSLNEVVGDICAYVQTEVPEFPLILSSMLACEGMQQADDLGCRLSDLFGYFRANCTQQP